MYVTAESSESNVNSHSDSQESNNDTDLQFAFKINSGNSQKRIMLDITLNGKPVSMQLDTAADVTILSQSVAQSIPDVKITPCKMQLQDFGGNDIKVVGAIDVDVCYGQKEYKNLSAVVVEGQDRSLFGLNWLQHIKLDWSKICSVKAKVLKEDLSQVLELSKEVFQDGIGTVVNACASLQLKPNAKPKFHPPRQIPLPLKPIEQEIQRLVDNGSWEKVSHSDWGTPIVPVVKQDGGIRLCGDYKVTVNPQLQVAQHPLPKPDHMFAALGNCKVFSKLDLRQAFQQLLMDESSQEMCTLSTHLGLYRPKRLPYGVASSPALWQQTMDKLFIGQPGIFCFVDDILVAGKDEAQHLERLKLVLETLRKTGLRIRKDKCQFAVASVEYLGFKVDEHGIHKTPGKVRATREAKTPENVDELKSFLGLITFYNKFIPNLATLAHPLYNLLKQDTEWNWDEECNHAVDHIKKEITSPRFLTHYQPDLPVKLVCDASSHGLGAVLAHVMPDESERPIAFASRSLNKAEKNYSQIEKEGLALVYGVTKFHMYLYGKAKFTLVTDHKPLLAILGDKVGLPTLVAARLQRWAITLAAYSYEIEYRSTKKMGNADALSRLPVESAPREHDGSVLLVECHDLPMTAKMIRHATKQDPVLSRIAQSLVTGYNTVPEEETLPKSMV